MKDPHHQISPSSSEALPGVTVRGNEKAGENMEHCETVNGVSVRDSEYGPHQK